MPRGKNNKTAATPGLLVVSTPTSTASTTASTTAAAPPVVPLAVAGFPAPVMMPTAALPGHVQQAVQPGSSVGFIPAQQSSILTRLMSLSAAGTGRPAYLPTTHPDVASFMAATKTQVFLTCLYIGVSSPPGTKANEKTVWYLVAEGDSMSARVSLVQCVGSAMSPNTTYQSAIERSTVVWGPGDTVATCFWAMPHTVVAPLPPPPSSPPGTPATAPPPIVLDLANWVLQVDGAANAGQLSMSDAGSVAMGVGALVNGRYPVVAARLIDSSEVEFRFGPVPELAALTHVGLTACLAGVPTFTTRMRKMCQPAHIQALLAANPAITDAQLTAASAGWSAHLVGVFSGAGQAAGLTGYQTRIWYRLAPPLWQQPQQPATLVPTLMQMQPAAAPIPTMPAAAPIMPAAAAAAMLMQPAGAAIIQPSAAG